MTFMHDNVFKTWYLDVVSLSLGYGSEQKGLPPTPIHPFIQFKCAVPVHGAAMKTWTRIAQLYIFNLLKFEPVFNAFNSYTSSSVKVFTVISHELKFKT